MTRVSIAAALALLEEIEHGTYHLEPSAATDIARARGIIEKYADFCSLSLADASIVALAERYDTLDILTLDVRHFR